MTKDEFDALYEELFAEIQKAVQKHPVKFLPPTSPSPVRYGPNPGISPTDVEARGRFPYLKPEIDEQGTYYGYKILRRHCENCATLISPRYPAEWDGGMLRADIEPSEKTMFGIHCTKRPDHPELYNYRDNSYTNGYYHHYKRTGAEMSFLVRCALSGTIVETEQGFRAQVAQIVGVYFDGHWTSYQDYQRRADPYSRTNPYEEEIRWRYRNPWQAGYTDPYFDPTADS